MNHLNSRSASVSPKNNSVLTNSAVRSKESREGGVAAADMDNAEILGHWSGLRPARRGGARLELDDEPDGKGRRVVHCYGHGGAGVTCSWGCADEVVNICRECVKDTPMAVARPRVDDRDQSNNAVRTGADVRSSKSAQILKDWILKSVKKGGVAPTPKPQEPLPQER